MSNKFSDKEERLYLASLARKPMAVGAIFFDDMGKLLIVKPTYKDHWTLPGGAVDADESPRNACLREVQEELGLVSSHAQIVCMDYMSSAVSGYANKEENFQLLFYGGVLTKDQIKKIRLPKEELSNFAFMTLDEALQKVSSRLAKRLSKSIRAIDENKFYYLEGGEFVE